MIRALIVAAAACIASGCATPYQRLGFSGGYSEVRLADDAFLVRVNGNGYTPEATLWNYLQRRAREVCTEHGYHAWRLESPGSQSFTQRTDNGYTVSRESPDTYTVSERGFRNTKHQVESVVVCGHQKPQRPSSPQDGPVRTPAGEPTPDMEPAEEMR